jgi:hypothetical protein
MSIATQEYADRLIDTISDCLMECLTASNAAAAVRDYIERLRNDPAWLAGDVDRVERVVMRAIRHVDRTKKRRWAPPKKRPMVPRLSRRIAV